MPLIIANGLPKSGSTFVYQVIKDILAEFNGISHYKAKKKLFPEAEIPDFVPHPTDEIVRYLTDRLPDDTYFVIKTHARLTPLISAALTDHSIKAVVTFRDPRDTIVSMLDAGVSDRLKGVDRSFGKLYRIEDAVRPAVSGWKSVREWLLMPEVLSLPFYLTAINQDAVIQLLGDYLGSQASLDSIKSHYANRREERITEFCKGIPDRFLDDLPVEEIARLTEQLSPTITEVDSLTEKWMRLYGYESERMQMFRQREERMTHIVGDKSRVQGVAS